MHRPLDRAGVTTLPPAPHDPRAPQTRCDIAIVGIGCRFPGGANDPQRFWNNLVAGQDAISEVPPERWAIDNFYHPRKGVAGKSATRWGGFIDGIDRFDAAFFGISPREAHSMDPQQRLLLEVAWEAFEDAGCVPSHWQGRSVGVFVGGFTLDYMLMQLGGGDLRSVEPHTATGSMMTLLANRLSYVFGFNGPSLSLDTACSSSLVAVHVACGSLASGESEMALAGGVNALLTPSYTVAESRAGMLSPTGRSKAFDASADGYVRGEGAGLVVLKTLARALADGDPIHAVIRATAVNQDGHSDGLTVPSGDAQATLMRGALARAGVTPQALHYVEAHGTGTPVGDPIEANAIGSVVGVGRAKGQACLIGSVKTNFGHTEAAAGIAGLIKAALVLRQRCVPPHLHLKCVNPKIDLDALRLKIAHEPTALPEQGPLYAAVNSFGFGGTNAHAILSSADIISTETDASPPPAWVLPVSARDQQAMADAGQRLADVLRALPADDVARLRDVCDTATMRREHHAYRACAVGRDANELVEALDQLGAQATHSALICSQRSLHGRPALSFVYGGMGPQWWGMGQRLYAKEPVFAATVDRCCTLFETLAGWSLRDAMRASEADSRMAETEVAQPANFVLQVALTELLASWGIRPQAIVGHSAGEPAAAHAAGVLSLEDAVRTIYVRSHLQQRATGQGRLLAVGLSAQAAQQQIDALDEPSLSLAAVNSPTAATVVGDDAAIESLQQALEAQGLFVRALKVKVPYHSVFMTPLQAPLLEMLAGITPRTAAVPLYSTVSGQRIDGPEMDAAYWYRNVRQPVLFLSALEAMVGDGLGHFVELGPHPVLAGSIRELFTLRGLDCEVLHALHRDTDETIEPRRLVAALHTMGCSPEWRALQGAGRCVRLPGYSWRATRYWAETPHSLRQRRRSPEHALLARRLDAAVPTWQVDLEAPRLGFLDDHQIQGAVVFPGAGYIEMAMHAARTLYGSLDAVELNNVAFVRALYLTPDQLVSLRLTVDPVTHTFAITSRAELDDNASWQTHCTGALRLSQATLAAAADLVALQARCAHEVTRADCYRHFRTLGLEYGDSFQGIGRLWQGDAEALALVEVPTELRDKLADFSAHPAVLDVCFQTLAAALPMQSDGAAVYMPVSVGHGRVNGPFGATMWCHARITARDALGMVGDILLFDEIGRCVVEIRDCRARAMGKEGGAFATVAQKLYEPAWLAQGRQAATGPDRIGTWLVHGGPPVLAEATMAALREAGCTPLRVGIDAADALPIQPTDTAAWLRLLDQAHAQGILRGVIDLGAAHLQGPPTDGADIDVATAQGCLVMLALTQALAATAVSPRPRLWTVTRGTQPVAGHALTEPLGAAVWGLGRVVGHGEHIDLWGGMIDLASTAQADDGARIIGDVLHGDGEDQIAWRDGLRHVLRVREHDAAVALPLPPVFRTDASYLVTGGLGALGLVVARWLVERGARHIVLVGREGLPPRERWTEPGLAPATQARIAAVRAIEGAGAQVRIEPLDIADFEALQALLARHDAAGHPPLRGVIHAAGVARPQLAAQMSAADFCAVMPPKLHGAWNLHRAFAARPLDFFTLFSSVASIVISMGQGNYAAANAGLDALAHWRRGQGLPANSINWGPWGDVGMATQLDLLAFFHSRGFFPMTAVQGCQALGQLMSGRAAQAIVLGAHWKTVGDTSPLGRPAPLLSHAIRDETVDHQKAGSAVESSPNFQADYDACTSHEERHALLVRQVSRLACQVLRIEEAALETGDSLVGRGLDSMMAIELKNRIEHVLKARIAIVELLKGASADAIAMLVAAELHAHVDAAVPVDGVLSDLVAVLRDLSPDQVAALMAEQPFLEPAK